MRVCSILFSALTFVVAAHAAAIPCKPCAPYAVHGRVLAD